MKISVTSDISLKNLERLERNLRTKIPQILDGIGIYMVSSVVKNFEEEGRPEKWAVNAPSTLKRKTSSLILSENGILKGSVTHRVTGDEVFIFPGELVYGRIHQKGGMAGPGKKVEILARPYLVFQEEDITYIENFIMEQVMN